MAMNVGGGAEGGEMVDINTTPLIDVMLVLLIMFIITIPIQTHAVKLDLPSNQNQPQNSQVDPVINRVSIDFLNTIYWNDQEVDLATLRSYFNDAARMEPQPEIHLKPDALSRYDVVNNVMAQAQMSGVTKIGFVGNEAYAN
ncbi:biopolymer transporter ExbD [Sphingosinicella microcystinivorans]|uniref:Biopolymer transporter ExbD n=2 Tax=Sphingosinicella microcystinivorans TaxID=335406 RepID=A0AAD1D7S5_SPHMI|nr:outer membrane transport energization protein ExbD [Sphingosinicella microcystinivorans]BBE35164.1 biopolymer transporter ExbD [Sphingosinicella microcystinivorans]